MNDFLDNIQTLTLVSEETVLSTMLQLLNSALQR